MQRDCASDSIPFDETRVFGVGPAPASSASGGFPIRGTFLGVPKIRNIVYWGLYWGPILGKYPL